MTSCGAAVALTRLFQYTGDDYHNPMDRRIANLVITGFSGTGKSLVAREVARRMGWGFLDTDDEIVRYGGRAIAEVFAREGEDRFREMEREVVSRACRQRETVIAVGGGAIVDPQNYQLLSQRGFIICLEARPETIYERLFSQAAANPGTEARPLLAADDPLGRIRELKASRQPYYANVDWTVHTDNLIVGEVAEEVVRAWSLLQRARSQPGPLPARERQPGPHVEAGDDLACVVETATHSYPVFLGHGLLDALGDKLRQASLTGSAIIISDDNVFSLYGDRVERSLRDAGFAVDSFVVPPGEETKSITCASGIYDYLVRHRVEREDIIVALGGGVVGDLAGFVAATYLRGVPWVVVPTSLIAMVDASIGGKVGVDHPEGKNLIGSFYQPRLVLADCQTLTSLPRRELISGWAEVIKHGLALDAEFFDRLEADADRLMGLDPEALVRTIARSAAIKARVVSRDEREKEGKRVILNYGHTIAHGLEAATGYRRFLHGEAVAIGMMGAARLSQRLGFLSPGAVSRQQGLLRRFGLPGSVGEVGGDPELSVSTVVGAMELDKKTRGKATRWVLLEDIGRAVVRSDVPREDVLDVVQELVES